MFKHYDLILNNILTQFSIKDLENLSGIKAHTIRIWEKRYNILVPSRTTTNIRYYNIANLQRLLNITLLYNGGYKISKIGALNEQELLQLTKEEIARSDDNDHFMSALKLSMLNFDQSLFEHTYTRLIADRSFRDIFIDVFIPLLDEIGLLWQSESITPAHEHFISNLIKQKLHINIERVQQRPPEDNSSVYALYLPVNEIHELGLLYLHYEIVLKGYHSIYLGQSVPMESLSAIQNIYDNVIFISYFTIQPSLEELPKYFEEIDQNVLSPKNSQLWATGRNVITFKGKPPSKNISLFNDVKNILNKV